MRRIFISLVALVVLAGLGFWAATQTDQQIKRTPLQKSGSPLKSPTAYLKRTRIKSGKQVTYDPRPRVEINGKPTALADLRILRKFTQLPDDGKPKNFESTIVIGEMSNAIHRFREGNWIAFGVLPDLEPQVGPGGRLLVKLVSKAAPGLVGCSAVAGPRTMKGVGEHMPSELEDVIPGYDAWPLGYTVGPIESLNSLSQSQRVNYILDKMVQFEKLGWITPSARTWYEKNLRSNVIAAQKRAQEDLNSEQISTEVFAMIRAPK